MTIFNSSEKSKKPKTITFAEEKNYKEATPIIFNKEKFHVVGLDLAKDQVNVRICNHQTEETIMDEIKWYSNHDLKTLIIDEVAKHLGYNIEIGGEFPKDNSKKEKKRKKMRIIQPTFEIIEQETGLKGVYKAIEYPGRICYGSTDKITEDSAEEFVHRLEKANHGAPMEHGAVYLYITRNVDVDEWMSPSVEYGKYDELLEFYSDNEYSKINEHICVDLKDHLYISTNYRVLFENNRLDDLKYLCEPTEYHHKRVTVKFTCNIGVSREFNRHRKNSINEESTRYCNYSKDKYGNEISVIENNNMFGDRLEYLQKDNESRTLQDYCRWIWFSNGEFDDIDYWLFANKAAEFSYIGLTQKCGWKAQDARDILPIDTKSILVHSAFIDDWKHFFNLRAIGTTGAPHPQAKELAEPLMNEFKKRGYIGEE